MRKTIIIALLLVGAPALASELLPREPLPPGVPDTDTPGKPVAGGMRYDYPYVLDSFGRYGLLDWCRDWGTQCGKPAAEAFCRQVDGGVRPRSTDFGHWPKAGRHGYTVVISTKDSCQLPRCEGFSYIVCRK
jgi:hypothetical protein